MPSWCRVNLQPPSWTRSGHDRFRGHHPDTRGWVVAENVGRRGDSWSYRLELPPGPDGRQRQKRVGGFATERQANAALATAQVEVSRGRPQYAPVRTFADLAEEWLTVVGPNRKETTLANYRDLVNAYLLPNLGALRLDRLATAQIQRLSVTLRERGGCDGRPRSGTHVRNVHRVLHNALGSAVKMGYLSTNPADAVERPKDDSPKRPVYTPDEVRRFLDAVEGNRLRALWHLAVVTGLRRGELAGLRWTDLNLAARPALLTVRTTRTTAGSKVVESSPKTRSGRRTLVLDDHTIAELEAHRARMDEEATLRGEAAVSEYVFVDEFGAPLHPVRLVRNLHALQDAHGLHPARSAPYLGDGLLAGVHPKVVSERHAHALTQITLDRYSHVIETMQADAAAAIGAFLSKSRPS